VLVVSGSAGHGHTMAGIAVREALRTRHPYLEVAHVDAVARMLTPYKHTYRWGYVRLVDRHPLLWRALYEHTNRQTSTIGHALTVAAGGGFVRLCRGWKPDLVVCTHFLAPELLSRALRKGRISTQLQVVVTDHDTHRAWYWPDVSRYYVATDLVKARLALTYGVPIDRIEVTGIPVRAAFATQPDPTPVRITYGLDPGRPTVLFLTGGFAAGPMGRAILGIWRDRRDVQVVAVCGRNERLRRRIAALPRPEGATLLPLGFVQDVRGFMAVSDLVVAKSGGVTVAECMASGKPLVVSGSIPGQEERNADAVVEAGAGVRALTPEEIRWRVVRLLDEPARLRDLTLGAQAFAAPDAAGRVADRVAETLLPEEAPYGPRFHGAV
jgi:processive 1,2-diacylglycerol beta-glucosyltransferase